MKLILRTGENSVMVHLTNMVVTGWNISEFSTFLKAAKVINNFLPMNMDKKKLQD
jgi:hypothetical protein